MSSRERSLIELIQSQVKVRHPDLIVGIGDDCAVIRKDEKTYQLLTTDCLVEKIHFDLHYAPARALGYKALAVNLSDVAAMGGLPLWALVSLTIPETLEDSWIAEFYRGMEGLAAQHGVSLIGGNLSRSPGPIVIALTLMGEVAAAHLKRRRIMGPLAAGQGDHIFVTGPLGSAALGLKLLQKNFPINEDFKRAQLLPEPQVQLGRFLGSRPEVAALIDVSDGLITDLERLLEGEQLGAELSWEALPRHPLFTSVVRTHGWREEELLLGGGEDYQLLFIVKGWGLDDFLAAMRSVAAKCVRIGVVSEKHNKIKVIRDGVEMAPVISKGFSHL